VTARDLPADEGGTSELLPSPPRFNRDYAESLIESALMGQIVASANVLLARARFQVDGDRMDWTLLLVPDAASIRRLCELLA
jgi:hypothetical protein